jgi:hypothetical protein
MIMRVSWTNPLGAAALLVWFGLATIILFKYLRSRTQSHPT